MFSVYNNVDDLIEEFERDRAAVRFAFRRHLQLHGSHHYVINGANRMIYDTSYRVLIGKQYYDDDGTLMNENGTRSIFDDVDE